MASHVEIGNRALTKLGATRITSFNDNSKAARALNSLWPTVLKAELSRRYWNFALARTSLPALSDQPAWGFNYQYQLPNDYLKLVQVNDIYIATNLTDYRQSDDSPWAIEGQAILCDLGSPLKIRYVRNITDPGLFHPLFVETLASKLAYEACYEITQSREGQKQAMEDYKMALKDAATSNAIERPPVGIADDAFILGRL